MSVLCQFCSATNPIGHERCRRCGHRLAVVSGVGEDTMEATEEALMQAQEDLEEHLFERITTLEDSVRQLSKALAATAEHLAQLEHNLTVTHAGVQALGGLLESQGILSRTEVVAGWERTVGRELLSRDLARRFADRTKRILSHAAHSGHASPEFRSRMKALDLALVEPDQESVRRLLGELVRLAPANDELWSFIGEASFEVGDLASARVAFSRVLALRGPHFESLVYLGTVASDLGDLDEAEHTLRQAHTMQPDSFLPLFTLGAVAVIRGDHAQALALINQAIERQETAQALYLASTCHLKLGHPGQAVTALRRALELKPDFKDARYQLGVACLRRGWRKLALSAFQEALELDPQSLQYRETVRLLSLEPRRGIGADAARLVQRAEEALEQGAPEAAYDLLTAAVAAEPGKPQLHASAALLASALGRPREAVRFAHRLLRQNPQHSPYLAAAVVALLESLRQAGRPLAARRLADRLYRTDGDPLARGMAAYELALVQSELGDNLVEARDVAREALEITPKELRHYPLSALGAIALKRGRYREASQYLEQAAESGTTPLLYEQLAVARLGAGDSEGAEAALAAASERRPGGLDEELLGHVRRLGSLVGDLGLGRLPNDRREAG